MPPLEAWEKVLLSTDVLQDVDGSGATLIGHGKLACIDCHAGVNSDDMDIAHEGLLRDPSDVANSVCANCHPGDAQTHATSLHATLEGYVNVLSTRWDPAQTEVIDTVMDNHCASCHASCGQCHVSHPASAGSGLVDEHAFKQTPSMSRNCTGCHGSRVKDEYSGRNEGYPADVHLRTERMACVDCHAAAEMHGEGIVGGHRYEGEQGPTCLSCHEEVAAEVAESEYHVDHLETVACEVCHSVSYKNCYNCHVQQSDEGVPYFEIDESQMGLFIGLNPRLSKDRPYKYVLLRHVPISRDSFEFYGTDLLTNFDALPTWVYATPHNSQLETPQSESCNACHGNAEWFLTADKVAPDELLANQEVIVETVPETVEEEVTSASETP